MPVNELESHPFIDYLGDNPNYSGYHSIIVGSFPIYELTNGIDPEPPHKVLYERHLNAHMPFFYGSKKNQFWSLISAALQKNNPINQLKPEGRKTAAIKILNDNELILTDIIVRTNRKEKSPFDSDLRFKKDAPPNITNQFAFNDNIIKIIESNIPVKYIFFTAQGCKGNTPGGWFFDMLIDKGVNSIVLKKFPSAIELSLFGRNLYLFFLPTPSSNRSLAFTKDRRHPLLKKFIQKKDLQFYDELRSVDFDKKRYSKHQKKKLKELRKKFLEELWIQFIERKNPQYVGNNPL